MTAPQGIQLRRVKGWRLPDGAISVARPTRWGNPFVVGDPITVSGTMIGPGAGYYNPHDLRGYDLSLPGNEGLTAAQAVALYDDDLHAALDEHDEMHDDLVAGLRELAGHDLACWCKLTEPCHRNVLLTVANAL